MLLINLVYPYGGMINNIINFGPTFVQCIDDEILKFWDGAAGQYSNIHGQNEIQDEMPRNIVKQNVQIFLN